MIAFPVSKNVERMHTSSTLKAAQAAAELRAAGHSVIDLTVGEPDFDTPEFIKDYAVEGLRAGLTKYTPVAGMKMFRESISEFYAGQFGADIPMDTIAASCGGKQALFNAACTLLDPGDELLIPAPYWVTFPEIGNFCGARNVILDTVDNDFILTADQVRDAITDKTKLLIVNSPNNPTGAVIPGEEMVRIIETCAERGVYVLTDEIYFYFVYPPAEEFTAAVLPAELREFVCIAGGFSKTFAMTGWRIGYTIAPQAWTRAILKLQSHSSTHPTSFVQYACAKAMQDSGRTLTAIRSMLTEYEKRKNWFVPALNAIDGIRCRDPQGAFYAFVDVRELIGPRFANSAAVAEHLLHEAHTVVTDGAGFGAEGFLRLSYATSMENLEQAVRRITESLGSPVRSGAGVE